MEYFQGYFVSFLHENWVGTLFDGPRPIKKGKFAFAQELVIINKYIGSWMLVK